MILSHGKQVCQLGRKVFGTGGLPRGTQVEADNADKIASGEDPVLRVVVEHPREDAIELSRRIQHMLLVERKDHLAIRVGANRWL